MIDSTAQRDQPEALRQRMAADGYLFFRRLVDPARAGQVKREIVGLLREHFLIEDDGADDAMWSGGPEPTESEWMEVYDRIVRLDAFRDLAASPEIVTVLEAICEEDVRVWEQQLVRVVYPEPQRATARGVGAHQDGDPKLGYQADRFFTAWVALMAIDANVGGLAVVPGSHRGPLLESAGAAASSTKQASTASYGLDAGSMDWASTDYAPGSAVIFHCRTIHRGLPNHSDRVRLSADFRYQPATDTSSWLAHTLGPDVRRVAQAIDETLSSRALHVTEGATAALLGEVRRHMLEEKNPSLGRARELVRTLRDKAPHRN